MKIEAVDERDMLLITPEPSFRIIDIWLNPDDGSWDKSQAFNMTSANLAQVQEWVRSNHQECDISELYGYAENSLSGERNFLLLEIINHHDSPV